MKITEVTKSYFTVKNLYNLEKKPVKDIQNTYYVTWVIKP